MDQLVLDASVIAKLFLKEEGSEIAVKLKDRHVKGDIEIMAPSLLKYELINLLKYKGFSKLEIKEALEVIRDYGFSIVELSDALFNEAAELSADYNISTYDAAYIALAKELSAMMCTADAKLLKKVRRLKYIRHLSEF